MFLIDTNVVPELRRRKRAHPNVLAWADQIEPVRLFLSAVTILELQVGALLLARRDPARAGVLQRWMTGDSRRASLAAYCRLTNPWRSDALHYTFQIPSPSATL